MGGLFVPSARGLGEDSEGHPRHCLGLSLMALLSSTVPVSSVMCPASLAPLDGPLASHRAPFSGKTTCTTGLGLQLTQ